MSNAGLGPWPSCCCCCPPPPRTNGPGLAIFAVLLVSVTSKGFIFFELGCSGLEVGRAYSEQRPGDGDSSRIGSMLDTFPSCLCVL